VETPVISASFACDKRHFLRFSFKFRMKTSRRLAILSSCYLSCESPVLKNTLYMGYIEFYIHHIVSNLQRIRQIRGIYNSQVTYEVMI
jgi:hypothetical protein